VRWVEPGNFPNLQQSIADESHFADGQREIWWIEIGLGSVAETGKNCGTYSSRAGAAIAGSRELAKPMPNRLGHGHLKRCDRSAKSSGEGD